MISTTQNHRQKDKIYSQLNIYQRVKPGARLAAWYIKIHGCDFAPNVVPIMPVWALSLLSLWQLDMGPAEATEAGTASIGIGTSWNVGMVQCLKRTKMTVCGGSIGSTPDKV